MEGSQHMLREHPTNKVMVNKCFGGFGFSQAAMDEYRKLHPDACEDAIERDDQDMIQIVETMGSELASGLRAEIEVETIPARFADHYSFTEYDGTEDIKIHYAQYRVDCAKNVLLDAALTDAQKLARVAEILNEELSGE